MFSAFYKVVTLNKFVKLSIVSTSTFILCASLFNGFVNQVTAVCRCVLPVYATRKGSHSREGGTMAKAEPPMRYCFYVNKRKLAKDRTADERYTGSVEETSL